MARTFAAFILVLALGVAGCQASSESTPTPVPPTPSASARGPITFAAPGDPTGTLAADIRAWNALNPAEPVTLRELSQSADARRTDLRTRADNGDGAYTVMAVDVAFVPELAKAGAFAPLASSDFPTDGLLAASVAAGSVDGQQYAYPYTADAGLLYYRKDLLDAAHLTPPTTWTGLAQECAALAATHPQGCYAAPYAPGETLTVSVLEAVQGAGGAAFTFAGMPQFGAYPASAGVSWMFDGLRTGRTSAAALTLDDDLARRAFERGDAVFMRGWGTAWPLIGTGAGAVIDRTQVGVADLPGVSGVAASVLGGFDLAICANGGNLDTARDFVRFLTSAPRQLGRFTATGAGPTIDALYSDPVLTNATGPVLSAAIGRARPRPAVADYAALSTAVSDAMTRILQGADQPSQALAALQGKLVKVVAER